MLLIIDGQFKGIYWSSFLLPVSDEAQAVDALADWTAQGLVLEKVMLVDGPQQKEIPIHLFAEPDLVKKFESLHSQWQQVLGEHPLSTAQVDQQRQINIIRKRIAYYEKQINSLEISLGRLRQKLKKYAAPPRNTARQAVFEQWRLTYRKLADHISTITTSQESFRNLLHKLEQNKL